MGGRLQRNKLFLQQHRGEGKAGSEKDLGEKQKEEGEKERGGHWRSFLVRAGEQAMNPIRICCWPLGP